MPAELDDTAPPPSHPAVSAAAAFEDTVHLTDGSRPRGAIDALPAPSVAREDLPTALALTGPGGIRLALDRPIIVGRRPAPPRAPLGVPELLTVPSPRGEISASHLEVRPLGRSVVATDLRSANGSTVTLPGGRPRPLARGESLVVSAGTRLDLGDGVVLRIVEIDEETSR